MLHLTIPCSTTYYPNEILVDGRSFRITYSYSYEYFTSLQYPIRLLVTLTKSLSTPFLPRYILLLLRVPYFRARPVYSSGILWSTDLGLCPLVDLAGATVLSKLLNSTFYLWNENSMSTDYGVCLWIKLFLLYSDLCVHTCLVS